MIKKIEEDEKVMQKIVYGEVVKEKEKYYIYQINIFSNLVKKLKMIF